MGALAGGISMGLAGLIKSVIHSAGHGGSVALADFVGLLFVTAFGVLFGAVVGGALLGTLALFSPRR
jgi:hypothetical protein